MPEKKQQTKQTREEALQEKAIDIKGKQYVLVSDRVIYFNEKYPKGQIITELLTLSDERIALFRARIFPDTSNRERYFTGYSQAIKGDGFINKSAHIENAETSAVGRALAFMGIGVIDSIASIDEIQKAENQTKQQQKDPYELAQQAITGAKTEAILVKLQNRIEDSKNFTDKEREKLLNILADRLFELGINVKDDEAK